MVESSSFTEYDASTMWRYTEDHLRNWGFEDLIEKFRDKNLTLDVLEVLTPIELGDLIPDIARRSAFWRNFQSWNQDFKKIQKRQTSPLVNFRAISDPELYDLDTSVSPITIGTPEMNILDKMIAFRPTSSPTANISVRSDELEEEGAQQLQVMTTPDADVAGCSSTPSRTRQVLVNPEIGRPVASQTPDAHKTDDTALKDILEASTEGKALLVQGMSLGALPSDMHRRMLSRLVVNHLLDDPSTSTCDVVKLSGGSGVQRLINDSTDSTDHINNTAADAAAAFVSELYSNPQVPLTVVQSVISGVDGMLNSLAATMRERHSDNSVVQSALTDISSTMAPFRSHFLRLKHFQALGTFTPPLEHLIGFRNDFVQGSSSSHLVRKKCTIQVIQMHKVFQAFFSIADVWSQVESYISKLKALENPDIPLSDRDVVNVMQGSAWKALMSKLPAESSVLKYLPLIVFIDDFEVNNPLGSHNTIHSLHGVYISLPALGPEMSSKLKNIFLLGLCHTSDKNRFGNRISYEKVIDELNYLQNVGIEVTNDSFSGTVKFLTVAMTGDNAGVNASLGVSMSWRGKQGSCRVCTATHEQIQLLHFEEPTLLRSMTVYYEQLALDKPSETGIREPCAWLRLQNFSLYDNVSPDLMHDVFEGCGWYVMTFVINEFIKRGFLSFQSLENKIIAFDYGVDTNAKPSNCLTKDGSKVKLCTSASEMLVLIRYFGVIVGDNIPDGNDIWELYTTLRSITDRLLSHRTSHCLDKLLASDIAHLLDLYSTLSGQEIKYKFHMLTHYPTNLMRFGPLRHTWGMGFESKLRIAKIIARSSSSRINICKTIAVKNQWSLNNSLFKKNIDLGLSSGKKVTLTQLLRAEYELDDSFQYTVPWLKIEGWLWKIDYIVALDISEENYLPVFAKVEKIFLKNDGTVGLYCSKYETLTFLPHYQAYEVEVSNEKKLINFKDIITTEPHHISCCYSKLLITLRHPID